MLTRVLKTTIGKYVYFTDEGVNERGQVARTYSVRNSTTKQHIADIVYKNTWRKYVLRTLDTLALDFDTKCLGDIIEFIDILMEERKARLAAQKS